MDLIYASSFYFAAGHW